MVDLGLRTLSTAAAVRLNDLLSANPILAKAEKPTADEIKEHKAIIQKSLNMVQLVNHLKAKDDYKLPHQVSMLNGLKYKAEKTIVQNGWSKIVQLQLKLKALEQEEGLLQKEIEK